MAGQNFAPSDKLTFANVVATVSTARAAGEKWIEPRIDSRGHVLVGDQPLLHILERGGFDWRNTSLSERNAAVRDARTTVDIHVKAEMEFAELMKEMATEQARADKANGDRTRMLQSVDRWPKLRMREREFGDLASALDSDPAIAQSLEELRALLPACPVPPQKKQKAKEWFIYDQRELQKTIRNVLSAKGWSTEHPLAPAEKVGNVSVTEATADMMKSKVHAMLDFGNRTSYAYNLLTRASLANALVGVKLTVLVVPTYRFADQIDSNLTYFERVGVELQRVVNARNASVPLPLVLIGVEPDVE